MRYRHERCREDSRLHPNRKRTDGLHLPCWNESVPISVPKGHGRAGPIPRMERHYAPGPVREMRYGYHPSERRGRGPEDIVFYWTTAWRRLRKQVLVRDHYICQLRTSSKCSGVATEVHHIVPLEADPARGLDLDNLVSCCWWCHEETKTRKKPVASRGVRVISIGDGSELESDNDANS